MKTIESTSPGATAGVNPPREASARGAAPAPAISERLANLVERAETEAETDRLAEREREAAEARRKAARAASRETASYGMD